MQGKYIQMVGLTLISASFITAGMAEEGVKPSGDRKTTLKIGGNRPAQTPAPTKTPEPTPAVPEKTWVSGVKPTTAPTSTVQIGAHKLPICDYSRKINCAPVCNADGSSSIPDNPNKCVVSAGSKKTQGSQVLSQLTEALKNQSYDAPDTTRNDYRDPRADKPQTRSDTYRGPSETSVLGF